MFMSTVTAAFFLSLAFSVVVLVVGMLGMACMAWAERAEAARRHDAEGDE